MSVDNDFRFELRQDGGDAEIKVFGDFDMTGVMRLETELGRLVEAGGFQRLLLDLSGLEFIDSTALGLLIELDQRAQRNEFELSLIPGPRHVQRVFEVTQLSDTLPFREAEQP